ncbi:F-box domain containing protein [Pandoravirus salinus]|uniref:F-box domain containing protein n=1 Tax=Pandoravirus salinus TaxID=1349410 RepID=S4VX82_9VIRU|nr:F-box domain [Pandoravirus salinus]AGO85289.1 F-box domain containing protein [Pandoravirus salinus]
MLIDLPADVVLHIMGILPLADVIALSAVCRGLCDVAACATLWQRLFVRDFAHLYQKGLPAEPWPHRDHPDDPWHEIAIDAWKGTDALANMPPRCPPLPHLPAPFAHAFAAGKDWRWLYRVHAVTPRNTLFSSVAGPTTLRLASDIIRCDWVDGHACGYISSITMNDDGDEVVGWSESMYGADNKSRSWLVSCDRDAVCHETPARPSERSYLFSFRRDGIRRWWTFNGPGVGTFAGLYASGMAHDGHHEDGTATSVSRQCIDGRTVTPIRDGKSHGIAQSFWYNGDTMTVRYENGEFVEAIDFVCSPTCSRPEYASVRLAECTWREIKIRVIDQTFQVFVPTDDSHDARLFWRYVADGLVGWDPRIRRVVLDTIDINAE